MLFTHTNDHRIHKIIESTNEGIKNTETIFRNLTENQEFLNIDNILKTDIEATKRQLHQRKFKKLNYLKYKPQPIKDQIMATTQANFVTGNTNIDDPKTHHLRKLNDKTKRNKHLQRTTNPLEKAGITKSSSYTTPPGNHQQEYLPRQSKHQPTKIKNIEDLMIRKRNLNTLRIKKNILSQKRSRQEAILKPASIC